MFVGMSLLLRRLVGRRDAALFGALTFTFGGFNLLHFVHPNAIAIVAHLPWLLLAIDVALSANRARQRAVAELAVGLLTASQLLLGYPQFVWFSLLAEAAYVAWRVLCAEAKLRGVAPLVWAQALGALAAAIQLLPTMHALAASARRVPDADFANTGSLHPLNLVQLLAPYLFQTRVVGQNTHELGLYAGAVPCLLCIWLIGARRDWRNFRPLVRGLIVCGALALLLAAGEFGGLYRLQAWVPLANRFRFPCRAIVLAQFCIAVGAAVAIGLMLRREVDSQTHHDARGTRPLWIAFLLSVGLALVGPLVWPEYVANPLLIACGPLLVGAAAVLITLTLRGARGAAAALVVFTALDLSCYGLSYSVYPRTADLHEFVAGISLPPERADLRVAAAAHGTKLRTGDRMLLAGLQRIDGYAGLEPAKQLDYATTPALQLAGVGWIWRTASDRQGTAHEWTRIAPTAPRARLVTQTVSAEHLNDVGALGMQVAAVDQPVALPQASPGSARVAADTPGRITIETQAPTRQLLITTESYDSGWQAVVDGQPQPAVRVNGDFLGCVVAAGTHRVGFEFRPWSRRAGALASACGLGLLLCTCWLGLRRQPKNHHP